jgi:hypothetical protein
MKSIPALSVVAFALPFFASGEEQPLTYCRDIAPLLQQKCVECHREGGGGPFSLQSYRDASRKARTIVRVVEDRFMPPWHAIGGDIPLEGDRRLTAQEIEIIRAWAKAGKPEGDPADLPPPRQFAKGWHLGQPDLVVTMAEAYDLPAEGPDVYRNFVVSTGLKEEKFLRAIEFRADSPEIVHHALLFLDGSGKARRADAKDDEPGFGEMPIDAAGGKQVGGWVPGATPRPLPRGLAFRVSPGADIVIQTHFHPSGKPESEQSTIALYFTDEPPEKEFTTLQIPPFFGAFSGVDLLPDEDHVEIHDSFELPVDVHAFGAHAHAHYRGKSMRMVAKLPNGEALNLLNIPDWDMDWQEDYRFVEQVFLPAGTRLEVDVVWDNSAESTKNPVIPPVRVRWGFESLDEMGSIDLFVVPAGDRNQNTAGMKTLRSAYREHLVWCAGEHVLRPDKLAIFGELRRKAIARFDKNGDGYLGLEEREAAKLSLKEALP